MTVYESDGKAKVKRKHTFTSLKLRRISGVDRPAQEGATAVLLMKRADEPAAPAPAEATKTTEQAAPLASRDQIEEPMTTSTETKTDPAAELTAKVADLEKRLAEQTALAGMTDEQRAHYATLKGADAEAFRTAAPDARAATVEAAKAADAVVYKAADGTVYRKSDDARLVELAKRSDTLAAEAQKAREEREIEVLKARAKEEIPHLPGTDEVRIALLKAVDGIADEKTRSAVLAAIKANDAGLGEAFKRNGVGGQPADGGPEAQLEAMARKRAEKGDVTYHQAYAEVAKSAEGQALFAAAAGSTV